MNVVMTDRGELVEVQATGEEATFTQRDLARMMKLASGGVTGLLAAQKKALR
jgi:ribonuclease PH